ncbi:stromal cell-derived factor 2-like [Paramacrobiotus metropolitanus]|uniref:stromal cell-derived factor 2-like n=1 Tax=Paramacrobiotus metropolitanus TaxID=2943436 RepID=UPI002445F500|nr:stromal cell-derived factor 2-like [Paramacrobiotus metropolitanus]
MDFSDLYGKGFFLFLIAIISEFTAICRGSHLNQVTCGSLIKLKNNVHDGRLHSHEVRYGSGSGQQSVTGMKSKTDHNSYWAVKGAFGKSCERGEPIRCGSVIRLQHMATGKFLHSHLFSSPLSNNQEVSAFGEEDKKSDTGDNWKVVCDDDFWPRDGAVVFQHADTNHYLHMTGNTFGRPIAGQYEICGHYSVGSGTYWQVMEGVYIKPSSLEGTLDRQRHDEL